MPGKFAMLKFLEDGIYYICRSSKLKASNNVNYCLAPYKKYGFYEAECIANNDSREVLEPFMINLNKSIPKIILERIVQNSQVNEVRKLNKKIQDISKKSKQYFCIFCNKKITKFARHLENLHKNEDEVREFVHLPKGCPERSKIIETLRRKGDFLFNTKERKENEDLMVCRRRNQPKEYICCPNCNGYFTKYGVRRHYIKCVGAGTSSGARDLMRKSRAHELVQEGMLPVLKNVLAGLHADTISHVVKYDNLLIQFGNKLCLKYKANYHHKMIRSKLRLLGRLLVQMKELDSSIKEFACLYNPEKYDTFIESVNKLSGLSEDGLRYSQPTIAMNLGTLIKQIGKTFISYCIKKKNNEKKQYCKDFLELVDSEYGAAVNKTAAETQAEMQRQRNIVLPTMNDIKLLEKFLTKNRSKVFLKLKNEFSYKTWIDLASYTLVGIMLFNRRRVGEIERALIADFETYHTADDELNKDVQGVLTPEEMKATKKYIRFCIRGKLNRTVPVLLNKQELSCIQLILKYREDAGVLKTNPYIFGIPGAESNYLSACSLMRKFSVECGAKFPNRLRGTLLRKHIATKSAVMELEEGQISELANFMGHSESIHRKHYRISLPTRQIASTSKVLEAAIGSTSSEIASTSKTNIGNTDNSIISETSFTYVKEVNTSSEIASTSKATIENTDNSTISEPSFTNEKEVRSSPESSEVRNDPDYNVSDDSDCPTIIQRIHSGRRVTSRASWEGPEKTAAAKIFADNINEGVLPSRHFCQLIVSREPLLKERTADQLKAWVYNQINKRKRLLEQENLSLEKKRKIKNIRSSY